VGKPADFSHCTSAEITTIAGYQQMYLDEYTKSGMAAKTGNGGFFHSCVGQFSFFFSDVM